MRRIALKAVLVFLAGAVLCLVLNALHVDLGGGGHYRADNWFFVSLAYFLVGGSQFLGWGSGYKGRLSLIFQKPETRLRDIKEGEGKFGKAAATGACLILCGVVYMVIALNVD